MIVRYCGPEDLKKIVLTDRASLREAVQLLEQSNGAGILFLVDEDYRLTGTVTDGDLRRSFLLGVAQDKPIREIMNAEPMFFYEGKKKEDINTDLFVRFKYIPVIQKDRKLLGYYLIDRFRQIPISQPSLELEEVQNVLSCLESNWISSRGEFVNRFETQVAAFVGTKYALATSNGTSALHLALAASGIGPGDEVVVPSLTFAATANAVRHAGATPVFCDVERTTWNLCPRDFERKITEKTRGVIPVHLFGQPCDMEEILRVAKRRDIIVVEDAAEAHGAETNGQRVGGLGHVGCFSFFGNKIVTTGEGGMLVTNSKKTYELAKVLRDHGMNPEKKYWHDHVGYNYRLTNLQAAIGTAQMSRIDQILEKKRAIARCYRRHLSKSSMLTLPPEVPGTLNVHWLYSVLLDSSLLKRVSKESIMDHLTLRGIETRPFFYPIHEMPPFRTGDDLPNTSYLSEHGICLPSYVEMSEEEIERTCRILLEIVRPRESRSKMVRSGPTVQPTL